MTNPEAFLKPDRTFYLDDIADEVLPCAPTLEAWAKWLSEPDESWPHDIPVDGAEFNCSTIDCLATIEATFRDGRWNHPSAPEGATSFVQRYGWGIGWDADTWSGDLATCLNPFGDDYHPVEGETLVIACTKDGPTLRVRYIAQPPQLVVIGEVQ